MIKRVELQYELEAIEGVKKVFFQPPASVRLSYPCIIYKLDGMYQRHADDESYLNRRQYLVTVIDTNPDSTIAEEVIRKFKFARFDRRFVSDNLYHDIITLYY